ncbi:MAG TPA: methylmalonyl Co-A mutase-associated GTPase MeaB, partial [Anaerolineae bacterium]|nr:methylmalonyl Co-A mutase-associated GTPase MeaB [Anaerolineae bacterium]
MELIKRLLTGDRRAVARLISMIENDGPEAREALAAL